MIATASLIDDAFLRELGSDMADMADNMDVTTECISLSTASFDVLPPNIQELIKKAMENHLRKFGAIYLGALHIAMGSGQTKKVCDIFDEAMRFLSEGIGKIAEERG